MTQLLYAIYPGTVTLFDGTQLTWTAFDLAKAYGVEDRKFVIIHNAAEEPQGLDYFKYLHLKPRADNKYQDITYVSEEEGRGALAYDPETSLLLGLVPVYVQEDPAPVYRPDFDGTKKWIQETDKLHIYPDIDEDRGFNDKH